ncbi:MAG: GDP-mannose 4,6-dehydratase [Candidatus Methylacidiphilales bacterium]
MKNALITGITGQDGSYLTELLLAKNYHVHGIVRRSSSLNRSRIEHLITNPDIYGQRLFLHYCDLQDVTTLRRVVRKVQPDELYHLAGQSHPGLSFEIPESTHEEVAHATMRIYEICRDLEQPPRIYHASSSEIFGSVREHPQNEETAMRPTSPYGASKAFATQLGRIYRDAYNLFICNGIAYNHESPRRGENFVTMKICREVAKIKLGLATHIELGDTSAQRDWGYAPDYVEAMWRMLQQDQADDYVLATGILHSVQDVVDTAFKAAGLNALERVKTDKRFFRPSEPTMLVGDASRASQNLGWKPNKNFGLMIEEMVQSQITARQSSA